MGWLPFSKDSAQYASLAPQPRMSNPEVEFTRGDQEGSAQTKFTVARATPERVGSNTYVYSEDAANRVIYQLEKDGIHILDYTTEKEITMLTYTSIKAFTLQRSEQCRKAEVRHDVIIVKTHHGKWHAFGSFQIEEIMKETKKHLATLNKFRLKA